MIIAITITNITILPTLTRKSTGSLHIANQEGRTPLMVAASKGRQELVKRYLAAGAFVNLQVLLESETSFLDNKIKPESFRTRQGTPLLFLLVVMTTCL